MNIRTNTIATETKENLKLMLSFAKQAGTYTEEEITEYTLDRDSLILLSKKTDGTESDDTLEEYVNIRLDKEKNRVIVKYQTTHKYGFETIENDPDTNYQAYYITTDQEVTEFLVKDKQLEVTKASVTQTIKEDTISGSHWTMVNFNSIADFRRQRKLGWLPLNCSEIEITTEYYPIPEGYHITDGPKPIKKNAKLKKK